MDFGGSYGGGGYGDFGGGGGFFADAPTANGAMGGSGGFSSPQKEMQTTRTLLPVTVKQCKTSMQNQGHESKCMIDGREVATVKLVGVVHQIQHQTTHVSMQLDDGTGWLEVKVWIGQGADEFDNEIASLREEMYVRVFGRLQEFNGKRSCNAFTVVPVVDFNEITYHNLAALLCHLRNVQGQIKPQIPTTSAYGASIGAQGDGRGNEYSLQTQVCDVFRHNTHGPKGLSMSEVKAQLPNVPAFDLKKIIEFLTIEGLLYTTVDDDHYKLTE